jgi:hypothetical protein
MYARDEIWHAQKKPAQGLYADGESRKNFIPRRLVSCGTGGCSASRRRNSHRNMLMFDRIAEINDSGGRCGKGYIRPS